MIEQPDVPTPGLAEPIPSDEDHASHSFLYIPDLTGPTGWASHRVPDRPRRDDRRPFGFRTPSRRTDR